MVELRGNQGYSSYASMPEPFGIAIAHVPNHFEAPRAVGPRIAPTAILTNSAASCQPEDMRRFLFQ